MVKGIFLEVVLEVSVALWLLPKRNEFQLRDRPGEFFIVLTSKGGPLLDGTLCSHNFPWSSSEIWKV